MVKAVVRFRFTGNIDWGGDKKTSAKIIQEYLESELEIGNGVFLGAATRNETEVDCPRTQNGYSPKELDIDIITDLQRHIMDDEFAIRKELITSLESEKLDMLEFKDCGNHQHITAILN